jgi:outer membrane protein assembly factor BamB
MIATDDGGLLLCDYSEKTGGVVVYGENGKYIKTVTLKEVPFDIAFISRTDQYVVTLVDTHCIEFINKDLTLDKRVKLKCTNNIYGVATSHQYIYIGEYMKILVLDFSGIGLREILINGVAFIFYISVGHDSKIYVADGSGKLCSIEDETGNVRQVTSPESGNMMSKLVMDTSGNVYSPDEKSNCVYTLSSDLKLNKIITGSEFYNIRAICFNKNCSKLFVANNRGESIIVFNCT